jgi:Ser/Thr protein kinase RdoA (MazF antagonist)
MIDPRAAALEQSPRRPRPSLAMAQHPPADLETAVRAFAIEGELVGTEPLHRGHIHDTYVSTWRKEAPDGSGTRDRRYLHQRMNDAVFRDVDGLMHNVERITRHLADTTGEATSELEALELVPAHDGRPYVRLSDGPWRTYHFVAETTSFDRPEDPSMAFEAARAFGDFLARLESLPASELCETIPRFFSSPYRLEQLDEARTRDVVDRVAGVREELAFVDARRAFVPMMQDALADGRLSPRIVHGDTKLNNVLFDRHTRRPRCIVDLDTCMPGYALYDFGDLVRFTAATAAEDEQDLARVGVDLELYRALESGYLAGAGDALSPLERAWMPAAARLVTLTIGMRFLADHLAGDVYFKTDRPGHNLDRARVQLRLVQEMERRLPSPRHGAALPAH